MTDTEKRETWGLYRRPRLPTQELTLGYRWPRGQKPEAFFLDFHTGIRINRKRQLQIPDEGRFELALALEPGAELLMQPRPANRRRLAQDVQPVSEPDIEVEAHRIVL